MLSDDIIAGMALLSYCVWRGFLRYFTSHPALRHCLSQPILVIYPALPTEDLLEQLLLPKYLQLDHEGNNNSTRITKTCRVIQDLVDSESRPQCNSFLLK